MFRSSLALVVGLFVAASAAGNGLPPPPVGKKFVMAEHVITTEKAFPDHDFYLVTGGAPKKVEFGPKDPVKVEPNRPRFGRNQTQFVAVPKGAAEKYADAAAFAEALGAGKVSGQAAAKHTFDPMPAIDAADPRRKIEEKHVVERIDAKEGIVFRAAPEKVEPPKKVAPEPTG
ncbi:MAG TPA: hypothetical protein VD866_02605, partial [Urbifossiella sp.]|nr:hypothetical protein [Urbifossiella sp.]